MGEAMMHGYPDSKEKRLHVVLLILSSPKQHPAEWAEPAQHVVHEAEIDHLNQIAVEVPDEEEAMTARRPFRRGEALDTLFFQVLVPAISVAHVEAAVREAHS